MAQLPLERARLEFDADGIVRSTRYDDIYHPRVGAFEQARHVFLDGNQLPVRWQGRRRFVILETGFGLGNNFLATWAAWRDDPTHCDRLIFISIEAHPLTRDDLERAHALSPAPVLARALLGAWPPLTPDLHCLAFDEGRVQLRLAFGDVQRWLPQLVASVDAFYLDGFAPARNPRMWDERVCKALSRLAATDATLATWTAAQAVRRHLTTAGFQVRLAPGIGGKRDITLSRFAPVFTPRRSGAPARAAFAAASSSADSAGQQPHALIVGGGLAGCAAAWAVAEHGWRSTLVERHADIAQEASGNRAGLFHGIINAQDGLHARFNRAAALMIADVVRDSLPSHRVDGAVDGLLRLDTSATVDEMKAVLAASGLPDGYVQAVDAAQASNLAGIALQHPAWYYPAGGWVDPAGLARAYLDHAGSRVTRLMQADVHALQPAQDTEVTGGRTWQLLARHGAVLAEATTVVLANAGNAMRLLGAPDWPIEPVRGQISVAPRFHQTPASGFQLPRIPIAGSGYLLPAVPAVRGAAVFGATTARDDDDPAVRPEDHALNLLQLERLIGRRVEIDTAELEGRTGWRWRSRDRLPLIGAVPRLDLNASGRTVASGSTAESIARLDQPRLVPRMPGLFVFTALGSRGITWSALGARVLAACITGAPVPLEARLVNAVDPARFISRETRRRGRG